MKEIRNVWLKIAWWLFIVITLIVGIHALFLCLGSEISNGTRGMSKENLSAALSGAYAVYLGARVPLAVFAFYYVLVLGGLGLMYMRKGVMYTTKLLPIRHKMLYIFAVPGLVYLCAFLIYLFHFSWYGLLCMGCFFIANYFSVVWLNNVYMAYQSGQGNI